MGRLQELQARPRDPFQQFLRDYRPDLRVPENEIVMIEGPPGWSPGRESSGPPPRIDRGSKLYCPGTHLSGFERPLEEQRSLAPPPRRSRAAVPGPAPKPKRPARARKSTR